MGEKAVRWSIQLSTVYFHGVGGLPGLHKLNLSNLLYVLALFLLITQLIKAIKNMN